MNKELIINCLINFHNEQLNDIIVYCYADVHCLGDTNHEFIIEYEYDPHGCIKIDIFNGDDLLISNTSYKSDNYANFNKIFDTFTIYGLWTMGINMK